MHLIINNDLLNLMITDYSLFELYIFSNEITSCEYNTTNVDNLDFRRYKSLPNVLKLSPNLTLNGDLIVDSVNIYQLPNNLIINGFLSISYTKIRNINNIQLVTGNLYAFNVKFKPKLDESKIKGKIFTNY